MGESSGSRMGFLKTCKNRTKGSGTIVVGDRLVQQPCNR